MACYDQTDLNWNWIFKHMLKLLFLALHVASSKIYLIKTEDQPEREERRMENGLEMGLEYGDYSNGKCFGL